MAYLPRVGKYINLEKVRVSLDPKTNKIHLTSKDPDIPGGFHLSLNRGTEAEGKLRALLEPSLVSLQSDASVQELNGELLPLYRNLRETQPEHATSKIQFFNGLLRVSGVNLSELPELPQTLFPLGLDEEGEEVFWDIETHPHLILHLDNPGERSGLRATLEALIGYNKSRSLVKDTGSDTSWEAKLMEKLTANSEAIAQHSSPIETFAFRRLHEPYRSPLRELGFAGCNLLTYGVNFGINLVISHTRQNLPLQAWDQLPGRQLVVTSTATRDNFESNKSAGEIPEDSIWGTSHDMVTLDKVYAS